jgi:hypothetical protein
MRATLHLLLVLNLFQFCLSFIIKKKLFLFTYSFFLKVIFLYFQPTVSGKGGLIGHPVMLNAEKESRPESGNASNQPLEDSTVKEIELKSKSVKQRRNA